MKSWLKVFLFAVFVSAAVFSLLSVAVSDAEGEPTEVTATFNGGTWTIDPIGIGVKASESTLDITGAIVTDVNIHISGCKGEGILISEDVTGDEPITLNITIESGTGGIMVNTTHDVKVNVVSANTQMNLNFEGSGKNLTLRIIENTSLGGLTISRYSSVEIMSDGEDRHTLQYGTSHPMSIHGNSGVYIHSIDITNAGKENADDEITIEGSYEVYIYDASMVADKLSIYASMNLCVGKNDKGRSFDNDTTLAADRILMTVGIKAFIGSDSGKGKCTIFGNNVEMDCAVTESVTFQNAEVKSIGKPDSGCQLLISNDTVRLPTMTVSFNGDFFRAGNVTIRSANSIHLSDGCAFRSEGDVEFSKITSLSIHSTVSADGKITVREVNDISTINLNSSVEVTALTAASIVIDRCTLIEINVTSQDKAAGIVAVAGDVRISNSQMRMSVSVGQEEPVLMSASGAIYMDSAPEGDVKYFEHSGEGFEPMDSYKSGITAKIEGHSMNVVTLPTATIDYMVIALIITIVVVVVILTVITEILIRKK